MKHTLIILFLLLLYTSVFGQCWTSDLSEDEQLAVARQTFDTELFAETIETTKCYLEVFPDGANREEMLYIQAESYRKSGKLSDAVEAHDELISNFPKSDIYLEKVMYQKGITQLQNKNYVASIKSLKLFLLKFPRSSFGYKAHYWIGYAASNQDELMLKEGKMIELDKIINISSLKQKKLAKLTVEEYNLHIRTRIKPKFGTSYYKNYVKILLKINEAGEIFSHEILESNGPKAFDKAAELAVRNAVLDPLPKILAENPPYIVVIKLRHH